LSRLFADENFPHPVVQELRRLGHDVRTIHQAYQSNKRLPDPNVLALAVSDNRAVLTLNRRHFRSLHYRDPNHRGIIICTKDDDFLGQAHRIHAALQAAPDHRRQLIRIYRPPQQAKPLTPEQSPSLAQTAPATSQAEKAAAETKARAEQVARLKAQQRAGIRDKGRSHER
jgi:predicted nuclease of predicted toxin-antitoxin system